MASAALYPTLAKPVQLGAIKTKNAVLMASLTRNRSLPKSIPNEYNLSYYQQRAREGGAGMIFSEGTFICQQGSEWPHVAGIWDDEHADAWKKVTDAVHAEGTPIVAQLWHVGRVAHPDMQEQKDAGTPVYAPSAVCARGGKFRQLPGQPGYVTPTAVPDPTILLDMFENAAKMAKKRGFDGVELHSANGYLVEQFLSDTANVREDQWGGSVEKRCRFGLEAVKRLIGVYGADRVGVKLSPCGGYNDSHFTSPESCIETFRYYVKQLDDLGLAWMQITNYNAYGDPEKVGHDHDVIATYGPFVKKSNFIANLGYHGDTAEKDLKERGIKAVTFGQAFIGNPDYYRRIQEGLETNKITDPSTFYQVKNDDPAIGYTDYPFLKESTGAK